MTPASRELDSVRVSRALADPTRFRLLRAIAKRPEISCQELTARFPVSQATVSHHLRVLSEAGLVTVRAEGTFHHYRVVESALAAYAREVAALAGASRPPRRNPPPPAASRKNHRKEQST
ncbi:MAG TPA: metalloregulator ArsR/SmtB family transcription factor [Anaeromyxobacter sp.]